MLRRLLLVALAILAAGLILGIQRVEAQKRSHDLRPSGVGWAKSEVTVQIKAAGAVTSQAIDDVKNAINEWNLVLEDINGAPRLDLVSGVKKADIHSHEGRWWFDARFRGV
jgi:hypothetical protein